MPRGAQPLETLTRSRLQEIARAGVISDIYAQAQNDLNDIINQVQQIGIPRSQAEFRRLQGLQRQIDNIQQTVNTAVGRRTGPGIQQVYTNVQRSTARAVNGQLPPGVTFQTSFGQADANRVNVVAEALFRDLTGAINLARRPVDNIIRRVQLAGQTDQRVTAALGIQQLTGADVQQLAGTVANIIRSEVGTDGNLVTIQSQDGRTRRYRLDYYSTLVVRTRTREIATMATQQTVATAAAQLGIPPLVQITRHTGESDICLAVLQHAAPDSIFSLDPNDAVHPDLNGVGEGGPPWHPNCRHVATPFIEAPDISGTRA